ncbi:unnamed protein product [Pipistrellus nathusii]|uniref:F-box domain-containing protein n=1 Tax=Pipistrellus nathusii TaxID=59473 RepID=A0ABN9ZEE3_PIPNA
MGHEDSVKLRIQHEVEASDLVPSALLCHQPEKVPQAASSNGPQCPLFFPQMLTYILSFLPLSDQKEASLVSRAWYYAAQNALREVRCLPSPGPFSVVSHISLFMALLIHRPFILFIIHIHIYIMFKHTWLWDYTDE